ncbi:MAG: hypothetical protein FJ255_04555 [Phycisphaerae bacterium]|nr:hypothetical protein [Phycisphaerae bacterium]
MVGGLANSGTVQVLEASLRFAAQRQRLIAHNIANATTPGFEVKEVSVRGFREALGRALDEHRREGGDRLGLTGSGEVVQHPDGRLEFKPETPRGGIVFHDRNNRDLERLMQDLAENAAAFRVSAELLRTRNDVMRTAISQRV